MQKLLDAGMKVFDERGYQAARVDDVVKAARTSHGTFYLYFSNKEDLFRVLAEDCVAEMDGMDLGPVDPGPAGYATLRAWLAGFLATYRRYGPVIRAWTEMQVDDRRLTRLGGQAMDTLTSGLAARIAESGNDDVDPSHAAIALVAMVERLNYYLLSRPNPFDDDQVLDTLTSIVHVGMFCGSNGNSAEPTRN